VIIGNDVTSINANSFSGCTSLTSVTFGSEITSIGDLAFYGCSSLAHAITIPNKVTTIGTQAFYNCRSLPSIVIPQKVKTVGANAFDYCINLKTVTIEDAFDNTLTFTNANATHFANCTSLETLHLGRNLSTAVYYNSSNSGANGAPFRDNTSLKTVIIGSEVTTINASSFQNCTGLISVTNNTTTPQSINANVFSGVTVGNIPLTVPVGSEASYWKVSVWKDFFSINGQNSAGTEVTTPDLAQLQQIILELTAENTELKNLLEICENSSSTDVNAVSPAPSLQVYPNPAKGEVFIQSEQPIEKIEILDMSGRIVVSTSSTTAVNISHLPKGVYLVKIFIDGQSVTKKIIKE
jgi:hypothetical protein